MLPCTVLEDILFISEYSAEKCAMQQSYTFNSSYQKKPGEQFQVNWKIFAAPNWHIDGHIHVRILGLPEHHLLCFILTTRTFCCNVQVFCLPYFQTFVPLLRKLCHFNWRYFLDCLEIYLPTCIRRHFSESMHSKKVTIRLSLLLFSF